MTISGTPNRAPRALVIEDAADLRALVGELLRNEGFDVFEAGDGAEGVARAREVEADIVILDVGLPTVDGVEVCRRLRTFTNVPVIMLTGRSDETDILVGLSVGADDYVTKPFSVREFAARVKALLRRSQAGAAATEGSSVRAFGDLRVDVEGRRVWLAGHEIALTKSEFDLLDTLSSQPGRTLTRAQLIDSLWSTSGWEGDDHVIDVHVSNLRAKIEPDPRKPIYIYTVRGFGYRFADGS